MTLFKHNMTSMHLWTSENGKASLSRRDWESKDRRWRLEYPMFINWNTVYAPTLKEIKAYWMRTMGKPLVLRAKKPARKTNA